MAHADYNCCSICSSKMDYRGVNASHKTQICERCLEKLQDVDIGVVTTGQLKEYIREADREQIERLDKVGFSTCYYDTEVDRIWLERMDELEDDHAAHVE